MNTISNENQAGTAHPPMASGVDIRAGLNVIWRRRWAVVATTIAGLLLGIFYTLRSPSIYEATATLVIDPNAPEVLSEVRPVYEMGTTKYWATQEYYETQYNMLRSRPVAQRALTLLGVSLPSTAEQLRPVLADMPGKPKVEEVLAKLSVDDRNSVTRTIDLMNMSDIREAQTLMEVLGRVDATLVIQRAVKVIPVKDSHLVRISVEHRRPELAAELANSVASAYLDLNLDQKLELTKSAVDWLRDQVSTLKTKLERSELELYEFKRENGIVSASVEDRETMVAQMLSQLNVELSNAMARRITLESKRNQLKRVRDNNLPLDSVDDVLKSAIVQELKVSLSKIREEQAELAVRYTAEHPKFQASEERARNLQAALSIEIEKIFSAVQNEYDAALSTERSLRETIDSVKDDALALNKKQIEYSRLSRERDNNKEIYSLVVNRQKEADLTQMLRVNNVRQLEQAIPPKRPIKPRPLINVALATAFGLFFGLVLAHVVDLLDNTVKTQAHIEKMLALPFLGIVPSIKDTPGEDGGRDLYVFNHPRSSIAECCRSVRTNIMFMSPEEPARTLLVTSSGAREGKSTTALTLAITMAQSGAKTLIVDTDLRRPRLHKSFGTSNDIGVSNLIVGDAELSAALRPTRVPGLDFLACGPIPPNPAELLHTDAFRRLVERLRENYQRIIFDSPPVGAVTDAQVLAAMMDGVIVVVNWGKTSWQDAQRARRALSDVGGRLFGAILNNVDLDKTSSAGSYGYSYYAYGANDGRAPANS